MMTDTPKDPPLEVLPDGGCYVGVVVDLDSVRIRSGRTPYRVKTCEHKALIYNQTERRVWCENCERTIDNFDAFLIFTRRFEAMERDASHKMATANEALKSVARLRATKHLDRAWSGHQMAVSCPHCRGGILPEDFANGCNTCSREIEVAKRARKVADRPRQAET
jgi:ribosomal protein S27E